MSSYFLVAFSPSWMLIFEEIPTNVSVMSNPLSARIMSSGNIPLKSPVLRYALGAMSSTPQFWEQSFECVVMFVVQQMCHQVWMSTSKQSIVQANFFRKNDTKYCWRGFCKLFPCWSLYRILYFTIQCRGFCFRLRIHNRYQSIVVLISLRLI